jgi:ribosome maturation factor RimP
MFFKSGPACPFFIYMAQNKTLEQLELLIVPIVKAMGYELWGLELHPSGRHTLLRIYIDVLGGDTRTGVSIDDCAKVSNQVSAILDVEDPIASSYNLEVSSPGLERPLFKLEQYKKYIGEKIELRLQQQLEGQKKIIGILQAITDSTIELQVNAKVITIPFAIIDKAHVIPVFKM